MYFCDEERGEGKTKHFQSNVFEPPNSFVLPSSGGTAGSGGYPVVW